MVSTDNQELFQKYYQAEYDFNTTSLSEIDIDEIKALVKEKRVNYALAPIGEKIFEWISEQSPNIHFEIVDFDSDKIDGMLYVPVSGLDRAYIILNSNKPFINQIFTATHEYYHYIKDYSRIKETPYICNFESLEDINEKKASRFAAEFLLPEEALRNEIKWLRKRMASMGQPQLLFDDYAVLSIYLTVKYQMPLKAVIYRLYEEKYIKDINQYIENYEFIKSVLQEVKILREQVEALYSKENHCLNVYGLIYRQMRMAYSSGYATREEILQDARLLGLDEQVITGFFDEIDDEEQDDDAEMLSFLGQLWEGKE